MHLTEISALTGIVAVTLVPLVDTSCGLSVVYQPDTGREWAWMGFIIGDVRDWAESFFISFRKAPNSAAQKITRNNRDVGGRAVAESNPRTPRNARMQCSIIEGDQQE